MTTFSDKDIKTHIAAGQLIHNCEEMQVGPACYELRMGAVYYDLTEGDARIDATKYGTILIKPGHRVVLITLEKLVIPPNIIARVTTKGSLFSVGLSPVSTYADPGFSGNMGIVTQNLSDKYILIPIGESIAKVDFSFLSSDANMPYRGQHGFWTEIWPIKHQLQKSYDDIKTDPRVENEEIEAYKILPSATARTIRYLQKKQRVVDIAILCAVIVNALVLAGVSTKFFETTISIATNLISTSIVATVMWFSRVKE